MSAYNQCPCCGMTKKHFDGCPLKDRSMKEAAKLRTCPQDKKGAQWNPR
jgi:hypothetical protein